MTMNEFVISALKDITYLFEDVQCRYRYDSLCEANYVKIIPAKTFKENTELKHYRGQILDKFYELFPDESLVFLTEGSSITFDTDEFKIVGKHYRDTTATKWLRNIYKQPSDWVIGIPKVAIEEGDYAYAA